MYFTSNISSEGMVAVYEALGWEPAGRVAVKLSTGEPPASNYLQPELIKDLAIPRTAVPGRKQAF